MILYFINFHHKTCTRVKSGSFNINFVQKCFVWIIFRKTSIATSLIVVVIFSLLIHKNTIAKYDRYREPCNAYLYWNIEWIFHHARDVINIHSITMIYSSRGVNANGLSRPVGGGITFAYRVTRRNTWDISVVIHNYGTRQIYHYVL